MSGGSSQGGGPTSPRTWLLHSDWRDYRISRATDTSADERDKADPAALVEVRLEAWLRDPVTRRALLEIFAALYGHAPPAGRGLDDSDLRLIVARLADALHGGQLVAVPLARPRASVGKRKSQPPPEPKKSEPPPPDRKTWFEVRVIDEVGEPVAGLDIFFGHGSTRDRRTTDGDGVARLDDVDASFASATPADLSAARDLMKPRWDTVRGKPPIEVTAEVPAWYLRGAGPRVELHEQQRRTVSLRPSVTQARLIGGFFETSKCFLLPGGVDGVRGLVRAYDQRKGAELLVVGHTDTAGEPDYNDPLAQERAEATAAYLTDDVEGWYRWYDAGVPADKRWGAGEDGHMLDALPDAGERPANESRVRWFQRTRGLAVDGVAGSETRHALIGEYMALDGTTLPDGISLVTHGCGENFPRDDTGDGQADPDNRRIEVFFFEDRGGVQPPPPGDRSAPGSLEYPEWLARAGDPIDFSSDHTPMLLEIEWSEEVIEQLPQDLTIELTGPRLETRTYAFSLASRGGGVARLAFGELQRGQSISLTAKRGDEALVLVRDQIAGDLEEAMVWEHHLEELLVAEQPGEDDGELIASNDTPDDAGSGEVAVA